MSPTTALLLGATGGLWVGALLALAVVLLGAWRRGYPCHHPAHHLRRPPRPATAVVRTRGLPPGYVPPSAAVRTDASDEHREHGASST